MGAAWERHVMCELAFIYSTDGQLYTVEDTAKPPRVQEVMWARIQDWLAEKPRLTEQNVS
jgi:hypothetical protein